MSARRIVRLLLAAAACGAAALAHAATFYISPQGSDTRDGAAAERPLRSFARAFGLMQPGDTLVLLNGHYSEAAGTGGITYDGRHSAQPPSGLGAGLPTRVEAAEPGKAILHEPLFLGRKHRKDSHIVLRGLTFLAQGTLYNTSHVTVQDTGFGNGFGIGTNDHDQGNTDNLVEDVWVWAKGQRIIAINYRSHRNVWRRVVVRGDGCGTSECSGSGNPNVGFTVYDSHDVSVQNVIVIDRVLQPSDSPYADFAIASHTGAPYTFGRNEWLGTISLNAPDIGYYMEPDVGTIEQPTLRIANAVAWNAAHGGFNLARDGRDNLVENITAQTRDGDGVRVAPELASRGVLRNALVLGSGRYAINSSVVPSAVAVSGRWREGRYHQIRPIGERSGDPLTDGSLRHLVRVEAGSPLKGTGVGGADVGANVLLRYGVSGTRFGAPGYNVLTRTALWPWPNEARIKADMCADTTRGFCSAGRRLDGRGPVTLTSYVWESLGHLLPDRLAP